MTRSRRLAAGAWASALLALLPACRMVGWPGSNIDGCVAPVVARDGAGGDEATGVSVIALGDVGTADDGRNADVAAALRAWLVARAVPPAAVFLLGDNFYDAGLVGARHCPWWTAELDRAAVGEQFQAVMQPFAFLRDATTVYALPGNHDHGCPTLGSLHNQADADRWLPAADRWRDRWQLRDGLPSAVTFGDVLQVVTMDSHRMITEGEFLTASLARLTELLSAGRYRWRVVAAHHPLTSNGPHGGAWAYGAALKVLYYPLHALVFPPFVYGSQNTYEWLYQRYRRGLEAVFVDHRTTVFLAGHEHSLELLRPPAPRQPLQVISGAGAQCSNVMERGDTQFSAAKNGFVELRAGGDEMSIRFVGTTGCETRSACAQPVRRGEYHVLHTVRLPVQNDS